MTAPRVNYARFRTVFANYPHSSATRGTRGNLSNFFLSGEIAREFIFPFLSRFNYNPIIPSIVFRDYYVLTDERVRGFFPLDNFMQISRYPRHTPRQT